jgi:hypothetical protein
MLKSQTICFYDLHGFTAMASQQRDEVGAMKLDGKNYHSEERTVAKRGGVTAGP